MSTTPRVEKGIPIPGRRKDRTVTVPLELKIGDSILIADASGADHPDVRAWSQSLRRQNYNILSRSVDGGVRIWRIA